MITHLPPSRKLHFLVFPNCALDSSLNPHSPQISAIPIPARGKQAARKSALGLPADARDHTPQASVARKPPCSAASLTDSRGQEAPEFRANLHPYPKDAWHSYAASDADAHVRVNLQPARALQESAQCRAVQAGVVLRRCARAANGTKRRAPEKL